MSMGVIVISVEEFKVKWKILRDTYTRKYYEHRKVVMVLLIPSPYGSSLI